MTIEYYEKKCSNIEQQLKLVKIGYREEVLRIASRMADASKEESEILMENINNYAESIRALEEDLKYNKECLNHEYQRETKGGNN